jgi:catechol 2,3-dioxygenase-like lactoylglutathione lyase family enzyme
MTMEMLLEVVQVPVSDVDRARDFYADRVGFGVDHDTRISDEVRVTQLTPPGSGCSIVIGTGLTQMEPGSVEGLQLTVRDMDAVRAGLIERGVEVSEVEGLQLTVRDMDAVRAGLIERGVEVSEVEELGRPGGPAFKHAHFSDPDGNTWVLQELPG